MKDLAKDFELHPLRDGRNIAVTEAGDPDGRPCLYFHGGGSSRLEAKAFDAAARDRGVRMIGADRPGVGRSDPNPEHNLTGWAEDVSQLADSLHLESFAVAGASAGGPHALACAAALPQRVTCAIPINTSAPSDDPDLLKDFNAQQRLVVALPRRAPWLIERVVGPLLARASNPEKMQDPDHQQKLLRRLPKPDQAALSEPAMMELFGATQAEGMRQGSGALTGDLLLLYGRDGWGFDPYSVPVPVEVFLGDEDVSRRFAERLVADNADARLHRFPGGHYGFLAGPVLDGICAAIVAA